MDWPFAAIDYHHDIDHSNAEQAPTTTILQDA